MCVVNADLRSILDKNSVSVALFLNMNIFFNLWCELVKGVATSSLDSFIRSPVH